MAPARLPPRRRPVCLCGAFGPVRRCRTEARSTESSSGRPNGLIRADLDLKTLARVFPLVAYQKVAVKGVLVDEDDASAS